VINLITDITYVYNNPSKIGDDGFMMFNCKAPTGTTAEIISEKGDSSISDDLYILNGGFSTKKLMYRYWRYYRQYLTATLVYYGHLPLPFTVASAKPSLVQKDISFLLNDSDEIDINKYIATYLEKSTGRVTVNGDIIKISHDLSDDFVKVTLGYEF